ncbi:hypothetical protein, unlikely [Trypanosoma congolense IL3000]|uniref:Uncharacterized protein n=1 Tax=Trypanosoma congolense (strain IL3000) TaxID=1068625 RepID=F9WDQ7_TRYCI|nr:hypothetical protein, unlikely [Trypanosoma congolense IL3000]
MIHRKRLAAASFCFFFFFKRGREANKHETTRGKSRVKRKIEGTGCTEIYEYKEEQTKANDQSNAKKKAANVQRSKYVTAMGWVAALQGSVRCRGALAHTFWVAHSPPPSTHLTSSVPTSYIFTALLLSPFSSF